MRLLLVCATVMELRACLASLPGGQEAAEGSCLRLPGCELDLLVCGVGPVAAALHLGLYLGREGPLDGILNLGVAGSYAPRLAPVGSLVLASEEVFPEYGVRGEGGEEEDAPLSFPQTTLPGGKIFTRLALDPDCLLGNMGLNWHTAPLRGVSVSVAGVSGTPERARRTADLTGGLIENMEGFSLALGAARADLPFAELRAVSNEAGLRPPQGWDMPAALRALGEGTASLLAPYIS